jgi:hypothetical protein
MTATNRPLSGKKAIAPHWKHMGLFASLTELVFGAALTQTTDGIQMALTISAIVFPTLIIGSFLLILWHKPQVFYPLTDVGQQIENLLPDSQTKVRDFTGLLVEKRKRKPAGNLRQNWAGALSDYREEYTSLGLQKKALDWRDD